MILFRAVYSQLEYIKCCMIHTSFSIHIYKVSLFEYICSDIHTVCKFHNKYTDQHGEKDS